MKRFGFWLLSIFCLAIGLIANLLISASPLSAEDFDWRNVGGQNWVSPVQDQGNWGACWAYAAVGALESKYMLTRDDATYFPNISEQQLVWETSPDLGDGVDGGKACNSLDYITSHGVALDSEIPTIRTDNRGGSDPWLTTGWQNRVFKSSSNNNRLAEDTNLGYIKNCLKTFGPLTLRCEVDNDWYSPGPSGNRGNHAVMIVGFHDNLPGENAPGGGYWIIKNSWGDDWNGDGFGAIAYATRPTYEDDDIWHLWMDNVNVCGITGTTVFTGAMATVTWTGGSTWSSGGNTWTGSNMYGNSLPSYSWENKETTAIFNTAGGNTNLSGTVIAHGLTINPGATGYVFNSVNNGVLTVTGGGITANESVTINAPVKVGAPQTWTVPTGKSLTIGGDLHTIISPLTINGDGDTTIAGNIDGGGVLNSMGVAPGAVTKNGNGNLHLTGAATYSVPLTASGIVSFEQTGADVANYAGNIGGGATITKSNTGTIILSGHNTYTGWTRSYFGGVIQADLGVGLPAASSLILNGGVFQSNSTITYTDKFRNETSGTARWLSWWDGGFAGGAGKLTVNLRGNGSEVKWTGNGDTGLYGTMVLSSTTAQNEVELQNAFNLNGEERTIFVAENPNSTGDFATISGNLVGGDYDLGDGNGIHYGGINKTGPGRLILTGTGNSYGYNNGDKGRTIISEGVLQAAIGIVPGDSCIELSGGVFQSSGVFDRGWYDDWYGNNLTWNSGGFAAIGGKLTVSINDNGRPGISWNGNPHGGITGTMVLNSTSADSEVEITNNLDLNGGVRTIQINDNLNSTGDFATISGAISDSAGGGGLTKTGLGTLWLTGAGNTYSGNTTVLDGKLMLSKSSGYAIPGNLTITATSDRTFVILNGAGQIAPTATVTFGGGNWPYLELNGNSQILAGISDVNGTGVIENSHDETGYIPGSMLTVNNANDCSFNGYMRDTRSDANSGPLSLSKTGAGTLTLAGGNITYSGNTIISGGKLVLQDITNAAYLTRGIANNGTLEFSAANTDINYSGVISGSGALNKSGGWTLTLGGTSGNTYGGATTFSNGTVRLAKTGGYAVPGNFTIANPNTYVIVQNPNQFPTSAVVTFAGDAGGNNNPHFEVYGNTVTVGGISSPAGGVIENTEGENGPTNGTLVVNNSSNCTYNAIIRNSAGGSGTLALVKDGTGTLTIAGPYSGSYSGGLTVKNGTLDYSGGALPTGNYAISRGTLNIGAKSQSIGAFQMTGGTLSGTTGVLSSNAGFDVQSGTINVGLAGTAGLTKTGASTVTLGGSVGNTYSGVTNISEGSLILAKTSGAAVSGNLTMSAPNGPTYTLVQGPNQIAASSVLTFAGGNWPHFELLGNSVTVAGISDASATGIIENTQDQSSISTNGVLTVNNSANYSFNGYLRDGNYGGSTGKLALVKGGSGTLTLSGGNTGAYTGGLTVNAGTLDYSGGILPAGAYSITGGTLKIGSLTQAIESFQLTGGTLSGTGTLTGNSTFDVQAGTINAKLGGSAGLTKTGSGTVYLYSANTYTGTTMVNTGTLRTSVSNVIPDNSTLVVNGGIFSMYVASDTVAGVRLLNGTISGSVGVLTSASTFDVQSGSISAKLGGSVGLKKSGTGTVTLSGANTYTGITEVNDGTLIFGASNAISRNSHVLVNGGNLSIANSTTDTVAGVQLLGGSISSSGGMLTSTSIFDFQSGTASAILGGNVGLKKSGPGTVTLSGANTYTGTTAVNTGTLAISDNSNLGTGGLAFDGGILQITASGAVNQPTTLKSGGGSFNIDAGVSVSNNQVIGGPGSLTKIGSGTLTLTGLNTYTGATLIETGILALTGSGQINPSSLIDNDATFLIAEGTRTLGNITGTGSTLVGNSAQLTVPSIVQGSLTIGGDYSSMIASSANAVPEPGTLILLVSLGMLLAAKAFGSGIRRRS